MRVGPPRIEGHGYETPCWIWQGRITHDGYGQRKVRGRVVPAHRDYYENAYGPLASPLIDVHHKCRMRSCVNPEHLEAVPKAEHPKGHKRVTEEQATEIRATYLPRVLTHKALAAKHGLSQSTIKRILKGDELCS